MSALVLLVSVVVGLFIGLLGGGGSILAVPLLVHGEGLPVPQAVAGGLVLVGAAALVASALQLAAGGVSLRVLAVFGTVGLAGSYAGGRLAHLLGPRLQLDLFTLLMLVVGLRMVGPPGRGAARATPAHPLALVFIACGVGLLTGLLGAGGGFLLVPTMSLLVGLPVRTSIGTSVAVLAITAAGGLAGQLSSIELDPAAWVVPGACAALASAAGARLSRRAPDALLRRAFGALLLILTVLQLLHR